MLNKSSIFYYFSVFAITFTVGLFVWVFVFLNFNDNNSKNFTASLLSDYTILSQESNSQPEQPKENSSEEEYFDGPVVILPQVISIEDQLDDIQEKLDIIQQQTNKIIAGHDERARLDLGDEEEPIDEEKLTDKEEYKEVKEIISCIGQINVNTALQEDLERIIDVGPVTAQKIIEARPFCSINDLTRVNGIGEITLQKIIAQGCAFVEGTCGGGGGGAPPPLIVYPKILISEVQIAGLSDAKEEFVELYNPTGSDIYLDGWYLEKKTNSGTTSYFDKKSLFSGYRISSNGYLLVAREGYFLDFVDIPTDEALSDNTSLILNNPNGEISDQISWLEVTNGLSWCADFQICSPTPRALNEAYTEPIVTDTDAPQVVFNILPSQTALSFPINFTITDISTTTTPTGLASYVFQWQAEGDSVWQEDSLAEISGSPSSDDSSRNFTGEDGKTYRFQVKATDVAGNVSNWLPEIPATTTINIPVVLENILINRIQVAGQTASDELVELYNPNNTAVDLLNFVLKKKTSTGSESNLVSSGSFIGTVSALGYFVIVPQKNDDGTEKYTGSVVPDLRYSGKSYSIAANNTVLLYDQNDNLQDKVGFGSAIDFETAPATNPVAFEILSRTAGIDINNNSLDFSIISTVTPSDL